MSKGDYAALFFIVCAFFMPLILDLETGYGYLRAAVFTTGASLLIVTLHAKVVAEGNCNESQERKRAASSEKWGKTPKREVAEGGKAD